MAQMKYEDFVKFNQQKEKSASNGPRSRVGYFALKDDGETAVVRFNIKDLDDIKIVSKHTVKSAEGKIRTVGCLRTDPTQPLDVCPLCAAGERVAYRAYVPVVYYEQNDKNETVPVAALWEQAPRIRETLKSFTMDYGDLRDYLFKIVRHGKRGDTATTYTILPANPAVYKEEIFKKDFSAFDSLDFERFVATKTADDMNKFLEEGDFPFTPTSKQEAPKEVAARPAPVTNTVTDPTPAAPLMDEPKQEEEQEIRRPHRVYQY